MRVYDRYGVIKIATTGGGGGGTPGGSDGDIQFNNAGAFGGDSDLTYVGGVLRYGGVEVGSRGFRQSRFVGATDNTQADDNGGLIILGNSGYTFTLDTSVAPEGLVSFINTAGPVTVASSSVLTWYNGSGALASGPRSIAVGAAFSAYHNGAGNWNVWGTGLS